MMNPYKLRRVIVIAISVFMPALSMVLFFFTYGLIGALVAFFSSSLMVFVLSGILLKHPLRDMIEGKGMALINLDSSGVNHIHILELEKNRMKNKEISEVFDRNAIQYLSDEQKKCKYYEDKKTGALYLKIDRSDYRKSRFAMNEFTVFFYNEQINSLITKDFLSEKESYYMKKNSLLNIKNLVQNLDNRMEGISRLAINSLFKGGLNTSNIITWLVILLIGGIVIFGLITFVKNGQFDFLKNIGV